MATPESTSERDRMVRECLHHLDELKHRPSQHGAKWIREVATEARDLMAVLASDLRAWERRDSADAEARTRHV